MKVPEVMHPVFFFLHGCMCTCCESCVFDALVISIDKTIAAQIRHKEHKTGRHKHK